MYQFNLLTDAILLLCWVALLSVLWWGIQEPIKWDQEVDD